MQKNTFSLDKPVSRRAIEARGPLTLKLPVPPSTNTLFINIPGRGRAPSTRYKQWRQDAAATLWQQPKKFFGGPVSITLTAPDKGRRDSDNFWKAVLDFLVHHQFIVDDSRLYVRETHFYWRDVEQCVVLIEPIASGLIERVRRVA